MASSVRISSGIFSYNHLLKNKYLPRLLSNRSFCPKDNDKKHECPSNDDSTPKEKLQETDKEVSKEPKVLSRIKTKPISEETKEAAKQKLMSLLSEISIRSDSPAKSAAKLDIARAMKRVSKAERLKRMEEERITPQKEMEMAVKAVASNFKEDSEKVESELNEKLNTLNLSTSEDLPPEEIPEKLPDVEDKPLIDEKISSKLMSSVEEVAETLSENPIPPRSELTKRLLRLSLDQKLKSESKPMRSVIEGMVIKSQKPAPSSPLERKAEKIALREKARKKFSPDRIQKVDLFNAKPLNIFEPGSENAPDSSNTFWQKLQEKELRLITQFAPTNAFEEMIMWTEQGKHWKFPIDNETEMGAEENVGFHEHVFLEQHLHGFPTKGPIRHFMELVCVGLSKNPYVTVERKIENIDWFRNYFKEKEEILRDAGAID